jgi:hypothetical protein
MRSRIALVAAFALIAGLVHATVFFSTRAYVVSVDVAKKSLTLRYIPQGEKAFKEATATWDEKTEWNRAEKQIWDEKPAPDLAKDLKKDTKVYVNLVDEHDGKLRLEKLKTIPPGETVD